MDHREYLRKLGRKGGKAGKGKSKARTSEQARNAVLARWAKSRQSKNAKPKDGAPTGANHE